MSLLKFIISLSATDVSVRSGVQLSAHLAQELAQLSNLALSVPVGSRLFTATLDLSIVAVV